MKAEIICIGDELLIGQVVNTNAAWIGQQLNLTGVSVVQSTSVADDKAAILDALKSAMLRSEVIIITGGLGPTKDDITKKTLCDYFGGKLVINEKVLAHVKSFFEKRNRPFTELNRAQAEVPDNCEVLFNKLGTAPGMLFRQSDKLVFSLPGVPFEMKALVTEQIIPLLQSSFKLPFIYHKTILTQGIGESFLAEKIAVWEDSLSEKQIKMAYLPSPGMVRLRLSGRGNNATLLRNDIEEAAEQLKEIISEYIYGEEIFGQEPEQLEHIIGKLLSEKKLSISLAESCTGGYISHKLTSVPGSSAYFKGSFITYSEELKKKVLGVKESTLKEFGAVSEQCVREMLAGTLSVSNADLGIAVSGIAGPGGGSEAKPVGMVWVAYGSSKKVLTEKLQFGDDRMRNIQMTYLAALNLMRKFILDLPIK